MEMDILKKKMKKHNRISSLRLVCVKDPLKQPLNIVEIQGHRGCGWYKCHREGV